MAQIILSEIDRTVIDESEEIRLLYDFCRSVMAKRLATKGSIAEWRNFGAVGLRLWRRRSASSAYRSYTPELAPKFKGISASAISEEDREQWNQDWMAWLWSGCDLVNMHQEAAQSTLLCKVACRLAEELLKPSSAPPIYIISSFEGISDTLKKLRPISSELRAATTSAAIRIAEILRSTS